MSILSKDAILGAVDLPFEDVPVPEWGGVVRIAVMSGLMRDRFIGMQGDGNVPYSEFLARMVVVTAVDEAGQLLFSEADVEALRGKNMEILDRLVEVALRINGMAPDAVEAAGKNSSAAPSGDSGSSSLSTSVSP